MAGPINVRLPRNVEGALDAYVRRVRGHKSTVIAQAVDEWLRLQAHPQIRFVTPVAGMRRAALVDGPEVWSVAEAWLQFRESDRTVAAVAEATGLRTGQVEAALSYWADNRDEIDGVIDFIHEQQAAEYEAWCRRQALDVLL